MGVTISWGSEIPKIVKNIRDGLISMFAGLIPFQEVMAGWFHTTTESFTTVCGVGILLTGVVAKMFGVTDSAVSIETKTENKI